MNNFKQREYYKIFSGSNQTGGYDKLHLGYESTTTEINFKKDTYTYFHVPIFTNISSLSSGLIIGDGAIPGPIPFMADRIFKKQGGYGDTTPWGNTTDIPNGTWLCSWLYSLSGETPVWYDRYYNPGKIAYNEALQGKVETGTYIKNDTVFVDVSSSMTLEPGVYYQYFHNGEVTANSIVDTFAGNDQSRLRLSIQDWSANPVDTSIYNNQAFIKNFKPNWSLNLQEPDIVDHSVLNFNNNNFIDTRVIYNSSYNSSNEFTINFWLRNDNWNNASSTQLVSNLNYGGYCVAYNNLKYYPYFVIPETYYGHLFYFNQEIVSYLDKSTQPVTQTNNPLLSGTSTPVQVAINSESEVIFLDAGVSNRLYKLNHLGDVLTVTKDLSGLPYTIVGEPKLLAVDGNNGCYVVTTENTYYFDKDLTFSGQVSAIGYDKTALGRINSLSATTSISLTAGTYVVPTSAITITSSTSATGVALELQVGSSGNVNNVNIVNGGENFYPGNIISIDNSVFGLSAGSSYVTLTATSTLFGGQIVFDVNGKFIREPLCKDIKFDTHNNKWAIKIDGNLYCNDIPILTELTDCSNIAIDPEGNLWVLYNINNIAKINITTKNIIKIFQIGVYKDTDIKNISFIYSYDRSKNTKNWYALIYHSQEQTLYQVTLAGEIVQSTFIPNKLNVEQSPTTQQDKSLLSFSCKGDFTGYEWKRIFNKVNYNNNPQIEFKIAGQKSIKGTPFSTFNLTVPVQYFADKNWHLITCTLKGNVMSTYIDARLRDQKTISGEYTINYLRKNDLFIGTPCGKLDNLNNELNSKALIFDGYIDDVKIYDYAIKPEFLTMFVRKRFIGQDLIWNIQTSPIQYVEGIERFFMHKLPGSKSQFFKLKLSGLNITDANTRSAVETAVKLSVQKTKPAYTDIISIEWV